MKLKKRIIKILRNSFLPIDLITIQDCDKKFNNLFSFEFYYL